VHTILVWLSFKGQVGRGQIIKPRQQWMYTAPYHLATWLPLLAPMPHELSCHTCVAYLQITLIEALFSEGNTSGRRLKSGGGLRTGGSRRLPCSKQAHVRHEATPLLVLPPCMPGDCDYHVEGPSWDQLRIKDTVMSCTMQGQYNPMDW
jgi:hypothetical protein